MIAMVSVLLPMERAIQETAEYCRQRKAFGQSILDNQVYTLNRQFSYYIFFSSCCLVQVVHYRLAELETEVELLRSLLYRTLGLYLKGHNVTKLASMGKLKAGRLVREVADSCLQFWGGMGYTSEVEISRMYRDVRLVSIGGGADEVMLSIICKLSGTLPTAK
jgi:citronellyl-CoA dehydrogenase